MTKFISSLAQRDKSNLTYSVIYIVENHQNIATEQIIIKLIFLGTIDHQIHKKQTYKQNKSGVSSLAKKKLTGSLFIFSLRRPISPFNS